MYRGSLACDMFMEAPKLHRTTACRRWTVTYPANAMAQETTQPLPTFNAGALIEISRGFVNHRAERKNIWYGYSEQDGHWGAIPFVGSLFRGQNRRHLPMFPAIGRGLESKPGELWERSAIDQARIVLRVAQSWWFARELDHHPVTSHAGAQRVRLDRIALAQHYGIPTGYLDLTDDFDVAAFFATCRETPQGWAPVEDGIGVVYRIELKDLTNPFGDYKPPAAPTQADRAMCLGH